MIFKRFFPYAALFLVLLPLHALAAESSDTKLLRSAYVLRSIAPGNDWESLVIPRRVITDDATNVLLKHPDTVFVITSVGKELDTLTQTGGKAAAWYYAAHASLMLGNRADAAAKMSRYIQLSPYNPVNYRFILRCLYENGNFQEMRDMATLWRQRDAKCDESRLTYLWGSYFAEKRHMDAISIALRNECKNWLPQLLIAKSRLELEEEKSAESIVAGQLHKYPHNAAVIKTTWNKLRYTERYP